MANYQYIVSFVETKVYSDEPGDYTKTFWNEVIKSSKKAKTKKELKEEVKELLNKVIYEHPGTEIRITGITMEISYNTSYLFSQKEYDELYKKYKEENEDKRNS